MAIKFFIILLINHKNNNQQRVTPVLCLSVKFIALPRYCLVDLLFIRI